MLDRRGDVIVLNAIDVGDRKFAGQYRILREAFEVPAPEGVTVQVDGRREEDSAALVARLAGHDRARLFHDSGVPGRAERGRRGDADRRRDAHVVAGVSTSAVRPIGRLDRRYGESRNAGGAPGVDPDGEGSLLLESQCSRQCCDIARRADLGTGTRCWHDGAPLAIGPNSHDPATDGRGTSSPG